MDARMGKASDFVARYTEEAEAAFARGNREKAQRLWNKAEHWHAEYMEAARKRASTSARQ